MVQERVRVPMSGWPMLWLMLLVMGACGYVLYLGIRDQSVWLIAGSSVAFMLDNLLWGGFFIVYPNDAKVLILFGDYRGTVKVPGFRWTNPFISKRRISLRVRNFETTRIKVNDIEGNPIEIAAVVVWRVVETAEASFAVDDYQNYVHVQSEAAVRGLATHFPYDTHIEGQMSLRGNADEVAARLQTELGSRLTNAGVEVTEARITHLAYAPEIAAVMLQRQAAGAIIAARQRIVEGAVGMVEMALDMLSAKKVLVLDEERKAAMVSNLLVVLCGHQTAQPVLNTGTLYQ